MVISNSSLSGCQENNSKGKNKMERLVTPHKITRLWKKMGNRAALASRLEVSEMTIRRWESNQTDVTAGGYKFEIVRLLAEHNIS